MKIKNTLKIIGISSLILGVFALIYTFFLSENTDENRKIARRLAAKAADDIKKRIRESSISKKDYDALIKKISDSYIDVYSLDTLEAVLFKDELKTKIKKAPAKKTAPKKIVTKKAARKKK